MHEGHLSGDFLLKSEMSSFVILPSDGIGDGIHCLDAVHNPGWEAS